MGWKLQNVKKIHIFQIPNGRRLMLFVALVQEVALPHNCGSRKLAIQLAN